MCVLSSSIMPVSEGIQCEAMRTPSFLMAIPSQPALPQHPSTQPPTPHLGRHDNGIWRTDTAVSGGLALFHCSTVATYRRGNFLPTKQLIQQVKMEGIFSSDRQMGVEGRGVPWGRFPSVKGWTERLHPSLSLFSLTLPLTPLPLPPAIRLLPFVGYCS